MYYICTIIITQKKYIMRKIERLTTRLLTLLMFLFMVNLMTGQTSRFGLVELNDKYKKEIYEMNDNNSCAVRLIASYFDISYYLAYDMLKDNGREHGKGANIKTIITTFNRVNKNYYVNEFFDVSSNKGISLKYFLNNFAEANTDYILIQKGHINYIKVGGNTEKGLLNTLYGNEKDRGKNIIVYLPIKKR